MGVEQQVRSLIARSFAELSARGDLPSAVTGASFSVERPKRAEHGDLATNAALAVQKLAGKPPRAIAELLAERLRHADIVQAVEIAGPGFLNLRLRPAAYHAVLREVLAAGKTYGRAPAATGE